MPPPKTVNLNFMKKKLNPPDHVYAIKQSGGNHIENLTVGDSIHFRRTGDDNSWGFEIAFSNMGGGAAPANITVSEDLANGAGPSEIIWPVPANFGTFKYDVSFPYDNTNPNPGHVVESLDPVIIINPNFRLRWPIVFGILLAFSAGAAVTMLALRLM